MIIVWLSIALVVIAIICFGIAAFKVIKDMKSTLVNVGKTAENLRERMEGIVKEQEKLNDKLKQLQDDMNHKKNDIQNIASETQSLKTTVTRSFKNIKEKLTKTSAS
ncbi:uncharacterized protein YoxC [Scopulibacillus daqui]|uniref:Uncharacterized protein YoxC n=1 Tax=Scopulibacillus daqui TaxID=1469162 RepID=A0ABS2PV40_9BACL|nr:DUF948 domain-containing protein [Scopulibacillus daqui]MBM7643921.1 uncharacterized protein YoxC [Scopulibacillus daqui]